MVTAHSKACGRQVLSEFFVAQRTAGLVKDDP